MSAAAEMVREIPRRLKEHPGLVAFVAVSAALFWLNLSRGAEPFWFDSGDYWEKRLLFDGGPDGRFSILNYDAPLRGYFLPLVLYALSKAAAVFHLPPTLVLEVTQALAFAALFTIIVPGLTRLLTGKPTALWQILVFSALVGLFWNGYFYYPLSDFWAVLFVLACVYLLVQNDLAWPVWILAGLMGGASIQTRPVYALAVPLVLLWLPLHDALAQGTRVRQHLLKPALAAAGVVVVLTPQLMINLRYFGIASPMPQTQLVYGESLPAQQLSWGIQFQRYESFVGSEAEYPSESVFFLDRHGLSLLAQTGHAPSTNTARNPLALRAYLGLVYRHPLDFVVIYARHLFNGLDTVYDTPYIHDLYASRFWPRLINYSLWFVVALWSKNHMSLRIAPGHWGFLILVLAMPSLISIPTAVECRFMLSLTLIAYAAAAFMVTPSGIAMARAELVSQLRKYLPWYAIFLAACFLISSNTFANMEFGTYLLR